MKPEDKLIKRAGKYDRKAQSELYAKYRAYWYALCLRYNRNSQDAGDVLQDALIQIFSKLDQFDRNRGTFKSWSGRIVINQSLMFLRKKRPEQAGADISDYHSLELVEETPIDILSAEEITRLIQKLPDGYRVVFNLYVVEGYSHKEIAELLNISEGTSKSQLYKAKKSLKEQMEVLFTS